MGSVPKPVTAAVGGDSFRIWDKDRQRVEQDIVEGRPFEAFISERGRFDAMFDFMLRSGLWTAATEMRPTGLSISCCGVDCGRRPPRCARRG